MRSTLTRVSGILTIGLLAFLLATPSSPQPSKKTNAKSTAIPPPPKSVRSRSPDTIAYMFHGTYVNAQGEVIAKPSKAALDAFNASRTTTRDAPSPPRDHFQYCAACLADGVPEPPAFSSAQWVSKGKLSTMFASPGSCR